MSQEKLEPVSVICRNFRDLPPGAGFRIRRRWDRPERLRNAAKVFGLLIGLTGVGALIPIAHYVLVPVLFLLSWVLAMDRYSQLESFEGGEVVCPRCQKTTPLSQSKIKEKTFEICQSCGQDLEVYLIGAEVKN